MAITCSLEPLVGFKGITEGSDLDVEAVTLPEPRRPHSQLPGGNPPGSCNADSRRAGPFQSTQNAVSHKELPMNFTPFLGSGKSLVDSLPWTQT